MTNMWSFNNCNKMRTWTQKYFELLLCMNLTYPQILFYSFLSCITRKSNFQIKLESCCNELPINLTLICHSVQKLKQREKRKRYVDLVLKYGRCHRLFANKLTHYVTFDNLVLNYVNRRHQRMGYYRAHKFASHLSKPHKENNVSNVADLSIWLLDGECEFSWTKLFFGNHRTMLSKSFCSSIEIHFEATSARSVLMTIKK